MRILDILARETENRRYVYLYEENGHWYAYEDSARRISNILNGLVKMSQVTYRKVICRVNIDRAEVDLNDLFNCPITLCSDSELVLEYPMTYQTN